MIRKSVLRVVFVAGIGAFVAVIGAPARDSRRPSVDVLGL